MTSYEIYLNNRFIGYIWDSEIRINHTEKIIDFINKNGDLIASFIFNNIKIEKGEFREIKISMEL